MDFKMDRLDFVRELYGSWESFCRYSVEGVIDETLSPFDHDHEVIEIEGLVVKVGSVTEADFYKKFPVLFRQKLYEQFTGLLYRPDYAAGGKISIRSLHSAQLNTWIFFLRNGYVPSEVSELYRYPEQVFETLIEGDPASLIEALHREWHQDHFRRRLTEQLKDESLIRIVEVEEPGQAAFIARFISSTQPIRFDNGDDRGSPSAYRSVLWIVTFSFLFFYRQSIFNRKEYLRYTIRELAAHYNLSYREVLLLLHACFAGKESETAASGIRLIIEELVEEETRTANREGLKQIIPETIQPEGLTLSSEKIKRLTEYLVAALGGFFPDPELRMKIIEQLRQLAKVTENEWLYLSESRIASMEKIKTILQELSRLLRTDYRDLLTRLQDNLSGRDINPFPLILKDLIQEEMKNKEQQNLAGEKTNAQDAREESRVKIPDSTGIMIENAGLVLLSPYLQRLFSMLKLTEGIRFVNADAQIKAIFLLQELLCDKRTEYSEQELFLNKLLTGYANSSAPLPLSVPLSESEKSICSSLLEGCKANWSVLKNTQVDSFCEAFLRRNGKLEKKEDHWLLRVEEKPYDLLLDKLPWNYTPVKFPWMEEIIHVQWR